VVHPVGFSGERREAETDLSRDCAMRDCRRVAGEIWHSPVVCCELRLRGKDVYRARLPLITWQASAGAPFTTLKCTSAATRAPIQPELRKAADPLSHPLFQHAGDASTSRAQPALKRRIIVDRCGLQRVYVFVAAPVTDSDGVGDAANELVRLIR
jgi:hypothetical protein